MLSDKDKKIIYNKKIKLHESCKETLKTFTAETTPILYPLPYFEFWGDDDNND